ncbi:hypothetical protein CIK05_13570 [Bdellovibrio sp. qaytius]|nr:hypothetical protein CIK05_13570 [Bdellovibrio sp. qaytius]
MKYLFLILLTVANFAKADILLVASKNTSLSDYKKICEKNNYVCLPQNFSSLQQRKTIHFDHLIETFDLDNKNYVSEFLSTLNLSLKEDDLNLDQVKNLILASEKMVQNKGANLSEKIKKLKKLHEILSDIKNEPSDKLLLVAGVTVANTLQNRLRLDPYLNEIKHVELDYISYTENDEKKYFLNGDCDHPRYTEFIGQLDIQVIPHFSEGCNLSQKYNWGSDLMVDHFKENKNKYLIGLAAVATVFFLKNYDVSIGE